MDGQKERKRLLFICSDYYPPSFVSGAIMNHQIVKYLGKIDRKMGFFYPNPMGEKRFLALDQPFQGENQARKFSEILEKYARRER
jgi:hypothetical protein